MRSAAFVAGSVRGRSGWPSDDELWWVDLPKGTWYRQNWQTGVATERHLGDRVSVVVPGIGARHIAAIGKRLTALESSGPVHVAFVEPAELETFVNDGKTGADGRLYFGTFDRLRRDGVCGLYRLDVGGLVSRIADDLVIGNGIGWSPAGDTMYVVDSHRRHVLAFDFDEERGTVSRRRVFVDIPERDGMPDGLTVDADGHLWVALYGGSAVHRYAADGRLLARIATPVAYPTSCAFAGGDLGTLVVTTSFARIADAGGPLGPLDGAVLVADVDAVGLASNVFGTTA